MKISASKIMEGLNQDQFSADYQPIFDVRTGRCTGLEALARWRLGRADEAAVSPPNVFIPKAIAAGLMPRLGNTIAQVVCTQAAHWKDLLAGKRIALNVCPTQLLDDALIILLESHFSQGLLAPETLSIELTEHVPFTPHSGVRRRLKTLKRFGCSIVLDDFGTGYMSFSKLAQLDVDGIKLSPNRATRAGNYSGREALIIAANAQLAHSLGLDLVVERIEHARQRDYLLDFPGIKGQGYFFSKPLSTSDATQLLTRATTYGLRRGVNDPHGAACFF